MAITRMGHIKDDGKGGAVYRVIKYIANPEKCEGGKLVGVNNIILNGGDVVKTSTEQIMNTKRNLDKTDGRQMYHFKISFAENDKVTPELAMQIAQEFCDSYLKDYETVYAVHTNTKHLHFHVAFNSVSFATGLKYHYARGDWRRELQPVVNELCRKYGLSEIDVNARGKKTNKDYVGWIKDHPERIAPTKEYSFARIRADVDVCIHKAKNYPDFLMHLKAMGYKVDDSKKHLRIFAPGRVKAVRAYILTPDRETYTKENIKRMIAGKMTPDDRSAFLERMYRDWNVYLGTRRTMVILIRRKSNLEFAQHEEAMRLILVQGFRSKEDVEEYRSYLEQADKELNVIKKYVRGHMDYFRVYENDMRTVLEYLKDRGQNVHPAGEGQNVHSDSEGEKGQNVHSVAMEAQARLEAAGVDINRLYKLYEKSEQIMEQIDGFKKKLFVEKKMADRIIVQENRKAMQQKAAGEHSVTPETAVIRRNEI